MFLYFSRERVKDDVSSGECRGLFLLYMRQRIAFDLASIDLFVTSLFYLYTRESLSNVT